MFQHQVKQESASGSTMLLLTKIIKPLDKFTEIIGKASAWLAVLIVLVTCYIVISRYVFNSGSIAVQESLNYLNAILVFFTAGFTLKHNAHVRVDIIYGAASERYKAWVNLLGAIFLLLPVAVFILISSWDYVMSSWAIREDSPEANGLPFVYLLKTTILLMCVILLLQGLTEIMRNVCLLFIPESRKLDPELSLDEEEIGTL